MIDKINQRIEDLTGLEMETAEELQVNCSCVKSVDIYIMFFFIVTFIYS